MASEPALILAFDTSASRCAATLALGEAVLSSRDEIMERGQAERLFPMLEDVLSAAERTWPDLDGIAVCTGPGNFTGLRLAVAAARGLALALDVPAVGVTTFEALAAGIAGPVLVTLEDRRGGVFAQSFCDGRAAGAPSASEAAALSPAPGTLCLGFDAAAIAALHGCRAGSEVVRADPAVLARLAAGRLRQAASPAPLYLRPADALPSSDLAPALLDDA